MPSISTEWNKMIEKRKWRKICKHMINDNLSKAEHREIIIKMKKEILKK